MRASDGNTPRRDIYDTTSLCFRLPLGRYGARTVSVFLNAFRLTLSLQWFLPSRAFARDRSGLHAQRKEAELNSKERRRNRRDRSRHDGSRNGRDASTYNYAAADHPPAPLKGDPENRGWFTCRNCGMTVVCSGAGTEHRNHCPNCLHSVHLDIEPGDREADCGGVMEPITVWVRKGGEWAIIHRCRICGTLSSNRIAADDNDLLLMSLAVKPLANPPIPLDRFTNGV